MAVESNSPKPGNTVFRALIDVILEVREHMAKNFSGPVDLDDAEVVAGRW